jgi:hypothetical protein
MLDPAADDHVSGDTAAAMANAPAPAVAAALRRFVVWMLLGLGLGLGIMLVVLRQIHHDPTPSLTPELFNAAHERWKANAVANYDIEVRVTGPQAAEYRVEVREGEPQAAWRNGKPLITRRTLGTWSVPGMFATISRDVEAIERAAAKGAPPPLILRAEFDSQNGFPARYRRIDNGSRKGGDAIAVTWDVTEFRVIEIADILWW